MMYVINWRYYDGSASGVIPYLFKRRGTAERFLAILQEHGHRSYSLEELKLYGEDDGNS